MIQWQPGEPLRIETKRFYLRSLSPRDAGPVYTSWWNDAEIQKGFDFPPRNWDMKKATNHVRQFNNRDKFHLGIYVKSSDELIGFYTLFVEPAIGIAVPNICIGNKNYWGNHTATEVGEPFLDFIFKVLGANKIEGHLRGANLASIAILKHFGFAKEGQLRQRVAGIRGERADLHIYGLLKEEWLTTKGRQRRNLYVAPECPFCRT